MKIVCFESYQMFNAIDEQVRFIGQGLASGRRQYVIVPDRFSLSMEKIVMEQLGLTASFDFEVLTISRLANLVVNKGNKKVLSMLDAVMLVQYLLKKNKEQLVCFNKIPPTLPFAKILFDSIAQIKSCKITPQRLKNIVGKLYKGNLQQKMADISLIYELYENYIQDNFIDSNNKINLLCEQLSLSDIFKNADVHFCNFSDWTAQDYEVIFNSIKVSHSTSITLNQAQKQNNSSIYPTKIKSNIKDICDRLGLKMEIVVCKDSLSEDQKHICTQLFALNVESKEQVDTQSVQLFSANDMNDEVEFVAKKILQLVRSGVQFRDICIQCTDFSAYKNILESVFSSYNMPFWLDQNFKLEDTEQYKFFKSVFDCVRWGFLQDDVLRVVMNGLSGLTQPQKEQFIFFAEKYGLVGNMWTQPLKLKNKSVEFEQFEQLKADFMKNIIEFAEDVQQSETTTDFCESLVRLNQKMQLPEKTQDLSLFFEGKGELKQASILRQSSEKIEKIAQQLKDLLGDEIVSFEEWLDMFEAGVQAVEIAPLPMGLNGIFIGQMLSSMFERTPYCFILGAVEGKLPAWVQDVGIISDTDILILEELNLSPTIKELNQRTVRTIQQNLTLATNSLIVTMPRNIKNQPSQPSRIVEQLSGMFRHNGNLLPIIEVEKLYLDKSAFGGEEERLNFLFPSVNNLFSWLAVHKGDAHFFAQYLQNSFGEALLSEHNVETHISNAEKLFFVKGYTKATELEGYFSCPFQHFIEYGLKLQERQKNKVRPVDIGNILHDMVERFAKYSAGKKMTVTEIEDFAVRTFAQIMNKPQFEHLLFGSQNKALAKGLERESIRICMALNHQNEHSKYKIAFTEASFGDTGFAPMPEIVVYQTNRKLRMRGKLDRVDFWGNRFRVIDYKTGKQKSEFHMLDLYLGKKIQLLIYLNALCQSWKDEEAYGAFYFPLHNEYQDSKPTSQYQSYRMDGVTINEMNNLLAQDDQVSFESAQSGIINFSLSTRKEAIQQGLMEAKEDKNLVTKTQMQGMIQYAYKVFSKALSEILEGYIEPKPFEDSCLYCSSKSFCPYFAKAEQEARGTDFEVKKTLFEEVCDEQSEN